MNHGKITPWAIEAAIELFKAHGERYGVDPHTLCVDTATKERMDFELQCLTMDNPFQGRSMRAETIYGMHVEEVVPVTIVPFPSYIGTLYDEGE